MILLQKRGKQYRCFAAFLADLDDRRQIDVNNKDEVLAFLKKHPDQHFLLICNGEPTHEAAVGDEAQAVFCGLVKWNSKGDVLQNKALTLQD